jgi:hypothetical protein
MRARQDHASTTPSPSPAWTVVAVADAAVAVQLLFTLHRWHWYLVPFWLAASAALALEAVAAYRLGRGARSGWVHRGLLVPAVCLTALIAAVILVTKVVSPSPVVAVAVLANGGGTFAGWRVIRGR